MTKTNAALVTATLLLAAMMPLASPAMADSSCNVELMMPYPNPGARLNDLVSCAQEDIDKIDLGIDPTITYLNGWLEPPTCTGYITFVRKEADASVAIPDAGLVEFGIQVPPVGDSVAVDNPAAIIAGIALIVAIASYTQDYVENHQPDGKHLYLKWEWKCTSHGYGVETNGAGNVARLVQLEAPTEGGYTVVGTPCEYLGDPVEPECSVPAFYRNDQAALIGSGSGESRVDGTKLVPPMPEEIDVCIDPDVKAVNKSQVPAMDLFLLDPATKLLDEGICSMGICIDYEVVGWPEAIGWRCPIG